MPVAQRSRACQQCRERRVKCDETPNVCQQCHRLGLRCSGPLQGSVIIDMTDRVMKPRPRKKREAKPRPVARPAVVVPREESPGGGVVVQPEPEPAAPVDPSPTSALPVATGIPPARKSSPGRVQDGELETQAAIARIQCHYRHPSLYQPSRIVPDALDIAFISHFVQQNNHTSKYNPTIPWITHIPSVPGAAAKPGLRLSIRATAMAFYAVVHRDTTILVDSYRWYINSLNYQRQTITRLGAHEAPGAEEILVPVLLSIYEAYAGTTETSIWMHANAATKMLEMRGPENMTGIFNTLFKIMRVQDGHKAIISNQPSVFASPEWMTIPFVHDTRSAHQQLADIILLVPSTLAMLHAEPGSLRRFFANPLPPTANVEPVVARIAAWLAFLDTWATRFPYLTRAPAGDVVITAAMANTSAAMDVLTNGEPALSNSFVGFTAASYETIRLILLLLLRKLAPRTAADDASLLATATASARAILDIAAYQESTNQVGGFDVLRTVFPLVVVGNLGPTRELRERARETLFRWGRVRGITGLCTAMLNV